MELKRISAPRLPDWECRLMAYLADRHARTTFGYDHHEDPDHDDCCTFSGGAVEAMTGVDPMAEYRGRYRTEEEAAAALKALGYRGTLRSTLSRKFRCVPPAFAQRGDLVTAQGMIGVCLGADAAFIGRDGDHEGLVRIHRADWRAAWSVGRG